MLYLRPGYSIYCLLIMARRLESVGRPPRRPP